MTSPIFFDETGKRRRLVGRVVGLFLGIIVLIAVVFAATLAAVPSAEPLQFGRERAQPLPFVTHVARLRHQFPRPPAVAQTAPPLRIGFYVPWDPDSATSLGNHYNDLDWVITAQSQVVMPSGTLAYQDDLRLRGLATGHLHQPGFLLMVQNIAHEKWDGAGMARVLADRKKSDALIDTVIVTVQKVGWQGAVFDVENMPKAALAPYMALLDRSHAKFARAGLKLVMTAPAGEPDWDLHRFASAVDSVIFMDYDDHWQGGEAGPIAAQGWFTEQLALARKAIPPDKFILAIGSYGYDWSGGSADALTIEEAWQEARDSDTMPRFDPVSGNSGFAFEEDGKVHTVWMMDAATNWNQLAAAGNLKGIALWRLGSEDPAWWDVWAAARLGKRPSIDAIPASKGTDIEGKGEILRIAADPTPGHRTASWSPNGMISGETYNTLPTPYVVQRTGGDNPKLIALTFDDGPDPIWTPKVLDILEAKHVPGAFFVIGENSLEHPGIVRRIVADGYELGNHSYTHPNLAQVSDFGTRLELNATQRLIESYTGRTMRLFRAPYFGDAEPSTAEELRPAELAQQHGYTIVGLHVDPGDWKTPGAEQIYQQTIAQIQAASGNDSDGRSANVVLLHDGGGNREQTVAALPRIIDRLRAEGYTLVSVAQLAGLSHDAVMPPISGSDRLAVNTDVGVFLTLAALGYAIRWLFFFAIALGISRAIVMTTLALMDRNSAKALPSDAPQRSVSVIIPAYNEMRVIVASINRVLASDYPALEVIVADDGSVDATSALVAEHFGNDARVKLLTMANGGKASAINRALAHASGEIIISLDADTLFLRDTIARLERWFGDPRIGAVAGNARVGNLVNLATRWQAIEYVSAQNVERRALDSLRAITVVPGAVGAWRREALDAVGGYPEDTLAEDQDLTIAIQRQGWRVAYDVEAIALTEAPETFRALAKQRFRWSFGTLQCLWKHRAVMHAGRPRGLAWFGMPQAWLFQIIFAAISPVIDLALAISVVATVLRIYQHGWAQSQSDSLRMLAYWTVFVGIDLLAGWIAYRLDPVRQRFPALLMVLQRFYYRQIMYGIVLRSISAALRGRHVGWGKLERTGRMDESAA
ncbi:MAG: glycosyltransferase [Novosphingobium sp.]